MREIGENARAWKGMNAGYVAKHLWIIKHYGKASKCELCVKPAKRYEWSNISGEYLRDRSDYRMLCPSCHRKEDFGNYCKRGHEYTEKNTYIRKEGWRVCKQCRLEVNGIKYA
jgi:hypothetical protein